MIFRKLSFQKFTGLIMLIFLAFSYPLSAQFINYQGHATTRGLANAPDQTIWANAGNGLLNYDLNGNLIQELFYEAVVPAPASGTNVTSVAQANNLSIPNNALDGATKMRVILARDAFADPCGTIAFGEVEDYTALIGASSASMRGEEEFFFSDTEMVNLAPNPTEDRVVIGLDKIQGQAFELLISNQLGQILLRQSFAKDELSRFTYDTSNLPTGIYFVWVKAERKKSIPQKLIKQRL